MRGMNIPVSVNKLTLGHRVGFIISHLTTDKLFPVNPRTITGIPKMSLLLDASIMPALIIKPKLTLVTHTDDLGWYITSNQQGQMFVQNLNRIVRKLNVMPRHFPYCTKDSIPIDLMFQENFPTHTQVWNCLSHRNDCRERGVIWVTESVIQQQPVLNQEHQSTGGQVFHQVHGLGRQSTDRNWWQLRSQRLQLHDASWS